MSARVKQGDLEKMTNRYRSQVSIELPFVPVSMGSAFIGLAIIAALSVLLR
jgi:hypothetical protein